MRHAVIRIWRGICGAMLFRPGVFIAAAGLVLALDLFLPPVLLSIVRKPLDYCAFNAWLPQFPGYLFSGAIPLQRKLEFVPDMALVGGPQSPDSEVLSKATYTEAWTQRPEFKTRYDALSNQAYVDALETNAEVTVANKATLVAALNAGQMTRGEVLRNIAESQVVFDRFFNRAFVAMQYFGYLRRDPDTIGFNNWLNTLNADPSNFRHMIFGFLFSTEYRQRFGP